jgi:hypothetical protein
MGRKILISFSGGRTSAFMAKFILEHEKYRKCEKLFVFANTGKEREETLDFVNKCDKEFNLNLTWVEADIPPTKGEGTNYRIVDFKTASRNGEPFEMLNKKFGLPSKYYRHCTRDLKEVPIHKYAKSIFGKDYLTAIGIRADEQHRIGSDPKKVYPLAEMGIDEKIVRNFWDRQPFDLELKDYEGNCDLCFLKSTRKRLTLITETPTIADWWNDQELKYGNEKQSKFDAHRSFYVSDLVSMAKKPFAKAIDKHELRNQQSTFDFDMDIEFDCFCKST